MRVLVLGAGFGGLELTTKLSDALGDEVEVVLIDKADGFVFGFSKLDVMFGRTVADAVVHPYRDLVKPGVRFVQAAITAIDPGQRRVETDAGSFEGDVMVVALGADLHPEATPGLVEGGHEFYTVAGAFALREVLAGFEGGHVVVGVTSTPFKCPPAPSETALMLHDLLTERGVRDQSQITLVMPLGAPVPPSPAASEALLEAFAERDITWRPSSLIQSLDPERDVATFADGSELAYDLFLGVPVHRAPEVVEASGLCVDGWIPVDPRTLATSFEGVYAVGDVTSVGTPKAGVFAEGQASVVADALIAAHARAASPTEYDGNGQCYLEFGDDRVAKVDVTFVPGAPPVGTFESPSRELGEQKAEFGTSRIQRWFGREWSAH
jgi:sulfide:quinone oxidoreductase